MAMGRKMELANRAAAETEVSSVRAGGLLGSAREMGGGFKNLGISGSFF